MGLPLVSMRSASIEKSFGAAAAISGGAALLLFPALINGFPFVTLDSEDYLVFTPLLYRSPYYGLFTFAFHLNHFIWMPILVQAVIASHLIWVLVRISAGRVNFPYFFLCILVLSLLSSLSIFVGYIMADIFAPVTLLVLYILSFHWQDLTKTERCYFFLLACVAIAAHLSHPPLALAIIACIVAIQMGRQVPPWSILVRTGVASIPIALAILAMLLNNTVIHRVFAVYGAGSTLLLVNMI